MADYNIVSERVVAAQILNTRGAYNAFFGAGVSVDAGVPTANQITTEIAKRQLEIHGIDNKDLNAPEARAWLNRHLEWDSAEDRYARSIRLHYASPPDRVDFFRRALVKVPPTFAHYAAALLMSEGVLGRTCLTTNFDKLLETAFAIQGRTECQALRTEDEVKYWREDPERCFCLKLHGDYDTHNILNTPEETVRIDEALKNRAFRLLDYHGLLVLGLAGYEESVYSLFQDLTTEASIRNGALDRGLFWGVYVGPRPAEDWNETKMRDAVMNAVETGVVGPKIKQMMRRMSNARAVFAFFPVFGAGQFLIDLIEMSRSKGLIGQAELFLDHEMRLRRLFGRAKLSPTRVDEHIRNLNKKTSSTEGGALAVERAFKVSKNGKEIWLAYGDIASRSYLGHESFANRVRAVVSPDDTFLSVGGGVATALAQKAGLRSILHEVSKFGQVPQGESRVTSGGNLPIHYIVHAATIEVSDEGYRVTADDVRRTFADVLRRTAVLGVDVLSVPLLGAGVAGLSAADSFAGLLKGYSDQPEDGRPSIVVFVVYREAQLARAEARTVIRQMLPDDYELSDEPWPPPPAQPPL